MQFPPLLMRVGVPLVAVAAAYVAWTHYGWAGVAFVASAIVMWMLLHFNRLMHVLRRATKLPVGFVGSAVMLNVKLRPRATLMHVVAMTKALGELRSPPNQQPEIYRWTDASDSYVECEFANGRLARWNMVRPVQQDDAPSAPVASE